MRARPGRLALVEQFEADSHRYIFGNPGTVEEGLLDALLTSETLEYVLALHETVAVAMADGYARSSRRPGMVQLHSGVGLGNAVGMLYQAMRGHSPLVVLAGDAGLAYEALDGQMAADLVAMAAPVTKWATRVTHPDSLLRTIRRAQKVATTSPCGPVFVALPMDVLDAPNVEPAVATPVVDTRSTPVPAAVARVAAVLAAAEHPLLLAGDGIDVSGAHQELATVADLLGAPVWGGNWSEVNMDQGHPQFAGLLGHMFGEASASILGLADAVLVLGTSVLPEVFPSLTGPFATGATVVHVDLDAWEIGKNYPVDIGIVADPGQTLAALAAHLASTMTPEQRDAAARRRAERDPEPEVGGSSDRLSGFVDELARRIPDDSIIFDEAITASPTLLSRFRPSRPGAYHLTRGGSLGVGLPGAVGAALASPDRTVIGFAGDGGSMYTYQALWTAARYRIPAKFVVCNNRSYRILCDNIDVYRREIGSTNQTHPPSFDLRQPGIRFCELAGSLGVDGATVASTDEIAPAIDKALCHPGPFLIDLDTTDA